jgi:hypothetical protein
MHRDLHDYPRPSTGWNLAADERFGNAVSAVVATTEPIDELARDPVVGTAATR